MRITTYDFEELPLILRPDGYATALIDGVAALTVYDDGSYDVGVIKVRHDKKVTVNGNLVEYPPTWEPVSPFIEGIIRAALTTHPRWKEDIRDTAVKEALAPAERQHEGTDA